MRDRRGRAAFSIMELILVLGVVATAFLVLFTQFSSGARHAVQTRNRVLGLMLKQSMVEEIQAHPYGQPAPSSWPVDGEKVESFVFYVEGRPQAMDFRKKMTMDTHGCIGRSADDNDVVHVTVTWDEQVAPGSAASQQAQRDLRKITADVPLRRPDVAP